MKMSQSFVLKQTYPLYNLYNFFRQQAVMIGQGLLESGWLEPVPNTRDGGAVFKDEYILYQPGVVSTGTWLTLLCTHFVYFLVIPKREKRVLIKRTKRMISEQISKGLGLSIWKFLAAGRALITSRR